MTNKFEKRFKFPLKKNAEQAAIEAIDEVCKLLNLNDLTVVDLKVAAMEAIVNAVEHGGSERRHIDMSFEKLNHELIITIQDYGSGFEAGEYLEPIDIEQKVRRGDKRGWGLHMIKNSMDDVQIESDSSGTKLVMRKKI